MGAAEVQALGGSETVGAGRVLLAEVGSWEALRRLAYGSAVLEFLGSAEAGALPFDARSAIRGSYAVRVSGEGVDVPRELRDALYAAVWRALGEPVVDLVSPGTEIHAFVTPSGVWWGRLLHRIASAGFEDRKQTLRPFHRSVVMPPRKARWLVNLTGVQPGETFLDPFCGTGSMLIEAALVGARVLGSDVDPVMVRGCRMNLAHAGVQADVRLLDARRMDEWDVTVDAIATDVPYGVSASLHHADRDDLYDGFLRRAADVLRPGRRAVVVARSGSLKPPAEFETLSVHDEDVHGSLTRRVTVLRRRRPGAGGVIPPGGIIGA